jgi:hypothetical protein
LNVYAYTGNDPLNATDPTGLFANVGSGVTAALQGKGGNGSIVPASDIEPIPESPESVHPPAVENPVGSGAALGSTDPRTGAVQLGPVSGSAGISFANSSALQDHFDRHGADFGAESADQYQSSASALLSGPLPAGVLQITRSNGDIVRFNPETNEFGVASPTSIRTYFIPNPQSMDIPRVWITSMLNKENPMMYSCPVCGYQHLVEPAYDEHGLPTFSICPSCGTEFGYDDSATRHSELRRRWIAKRMPWWSSSTPSPPGWDPIGQLKDAGFTETP